MAEGMTAETRLIGYILQSTNSLFSLDVKHRQAAGQSKIQSRSGVI